MGHECIKYLNGMFSLALYDKNQKKVWIARDRLGVKPLFYCVKPNSFIFSSDLNSITKFHDASLDKQSLLNYLGFSYVPEPNTIFSEIKKLEAAEQMIIKNNQIEKSIYWRPNQEKKFEGTLKQAISILDELLIDSTNIQLRSDVPIGIFLSGGLDSSAVAVYASRIKNKDKLNTYCKF